MSALTHQDLEPGMDVEACIGGSPHSGAWARARVLKSYSKGAQVRILDGKQAGTELTLKLCRVRLIEAPPKRAPRGVVPQLVQERVVERTPRGLAIVPPPSAPEPARDEPREDLDEQLSTWLEMGRDMLRPLEEGVAQLDEEIEVLSAQLVEIEEQRASAAKKREALASKLARMKKTVEAAGA